MLKALAATPHKNILITHGTFTMKATAQYIKKNLSIGGGGKKIVLTGSMMPLVGFAVSDAGFNLGFAVASFASIKPGVYLSMNGGIFPFSEVEKNVELFRFE